MLKPFLLGALALPLLAAAAPAAEPRDLLDPTARAYPGQVLPAAEIDARRGWMVFSQIDDARDALARGRGETAQFMIARAQAVLGALRREGTPDPAIAATRGTRLPDQRADVVLPSAHVEAQLAGAAAALRVGDQRGADRLLADAGGALRTALVRFDDRQQPNAVATNERASHGSSYGGSGVAPATGMSPPLNTSRFGSGEGTSSMSSGPNSSPGAYGFGTTGPGGPGSAIPGYGSVGGQPR
ncbi:MAG: hypothetical protein JO021_00335 [Alphaproteobacteria bacterium]|nr:hypothetical protein [Alphaproteobacteria bacterium]